MSIFGAIGKVAGKIKGIAGKAVAATVPGGGAIMAGGSLLGKLGKRVNRQVVKGAVIGAGAAGLGAVAMRGFGGSERKRYRRINPGNTRAMRRSIRRIEAGAKLYSKFFSIRHGGIKGAPRVRIKGSRRRSA